MSKLSQRYEGDAGRSLRANYSWELQVDAVAQALSISNDEVLYGIRYARFLQVLSLVTAKANAEAERIDSMERSLKSN